MAGLNSTSNMAASRFAGTKRNGAGAHVAKPNGKPRRDDAKSAPERRTDELAATSSRGRNARRVVIGGTLAATGVALAGGGLAMTVTYTIAGAAGLDRILLGGLAAGSDIL